MSLKNPGPDFLATALDKLKQTKYIHERTTNAEAHITNSAQLNVYEAIALLDHLTELNDMLDSKVRGIYKGDER